MTGQLHHPACQPVGAPLPADAGQAPEAVIRPRSKQFGRKKGPTALRVTNTKALIDQLRDRDMTRNDMGEFMQFSPSGVRKYLAELRAAHVVEVLDDHDPITGQELYGLTADADLVQSFIESLDLVARPASRGGAPTHLQQALRDKSRSFHLMVDDSFYSVRIRRTAVAPDPLALPVDFFRPAAMICASPPCAHFAKPAPTAPSFPVPDRSCFTWEAAA